MSSNAGRLAAIDIAGEPYDIGRQLGRFGAAAVRDRLLPLPYWRDVMALAGAGSLVPAMHDLVERHFPAINAELRGLADGLGLPFDDVFAWNCRGDLRSNAPDGCTTVQYPGKTIVIGHNEDGLPEFDDCCALATVRPDSGPAFSAFVYPGSLPGHTFGFNELGLVQTVNNIRRVPDRPGVPRMVLTRAILGGGLDRAVSLLREMPRAGGFHLTLAQAGDPRLLSVEFTADAMSAIDVRAASAHANHLVHPGMASAGDVVTHSSAARQASAESHLATNANSGGALGVLFSDEGALPIRRRRQDDPDHENTLATVLFEVSADRVDWAVYDGPGRSATHCGRIATKAAA